VSYGVRPQCCNFSFLSVNVSRYTEYYIGCSASHVRRTFLHGIGCSPKRREGAGGEVSEIACQHALHCRDAPAYDAERISLSGSGRGKGREREREREIKEGEETSVVRAKGKYTTSVSLLRESCVQKYSYMNWFSAPRHYETVLNKSFKNVS
jgi:hypothetical protein